MLCTYDIISGKFLLADYMHGDKKGFYFVPMYIEIITIIEKNTSLFGFSLESAGAILTYSYYLLYTPI